VYFATETSVAGGDFINLPTFHIVSPSVKKTPIEAYNGKYS